MILPVIGITLPFFSAGGSSTLCLYIGLGLVFSIYRFSRSRAAVNFRLSRISTPFSEFQKIKVGHFARLFCIYKL
jgi:hypothetical protein